MHIHVLGICGTFMGGLAVLAREMGMTVSGADAGVYPPMSTQLEAAGIKLIEGYDAEYLKKNTPDLVVIGNAMSRGNASVEYCLNQQLDYCSGPEFIANHILKNRWVLAVAGTHGKTTTSSMLAWILEYAKMNPGFLIGGIPQNFGLSARMGKTPFFVIEADEYDTAFFDKRSKFVHYHPKTLVINNLEFDHADIFENLDAIKRQFHHLIRTVPEVGKIIYPSEESNICDVMNMGCWSPTEVIDSSNRQGWWAELKQPDGSEFDVGFKQEKFGTVKWDLIGNHNVSNGLAAIAASRHVGVAPPYAIDALAEYVNTKRRLEIRGVVNKITIYDDFAHHPTAISSTLNGLRHKVGDARVFAVLEPRSNTMKLGVHKSELANSLAEANFITVFEPSGLKWSLKDCLSSLSGKLNILEDIDKIIQLLLDQLQPGDHVLIMSNGGFENIHERLLKALTERYG